MGAAFFVTFRLAGSIAKASLGVLKSKHARKLEECNRIIDEHTRNLEIFKLRKQYLFEIDKLLHKIDEGPHYLKQTKVTKIIEDEIKRFDGEFYDLICYCVMSNHVHILIDTKLQLNEDFSEDEIEMNYTQLDVIMKRIKGPTAIYSNRELKRSGQFWQRENYDIYIRNEKMMNNVIGYILENPVKAGLVDDWRDYPGNYYKYYA